MEDEIEQLKTLVGDLFSKVEVGYCSALQSSQHNYSVAETPLERGGGAEMLTKKSALGLGLTKKWAGKQSPPPPQYLRHTVYISTILIPELLAIVSSTLYCRSLGWG